MCENIVYVDAQIMLCSATITALAGYSFNRVEEDSNVAVCTCGHHEHAWCMMHLCLPVIFMCTYKFTPRVHYAFEAQQGGLIALILINFLSLLITSIIP